MNSVMDNKIPKVSVLLPVYNCEKYINESVDSILNQTFTDFELIIIDDKSTDNTLNLIKKYNDNRIIVFEKNQNSGYTNSLNYGISIAKGEFIARMDADDISLPTRFEEQIEFLESNPEFILCGSWLQVIGTSRIIKKPENHQEILIHLLYSNPIGHPSVMLKKEVLYKFKYDINKEPAEDYDLWTKLIWHGKMYNIQKPLLLYRKHDSQISTTKSIIQMQRYLYSRIELFKSLKYDSEKYSDKLLYSFFSLDVSIKRNNFVDILNWLDCIKIKNNSLKIFPKKEFENTLELLLNLFLKKKFENSNKFNYLSNVIYLPTKQNFYIGSLYKYYIYNILKKAISIINIKQ